MSTIVNPRVWTTERIAELKSAYDSGMSYPDMGKKFNIAHASVHAIVSRYYPERVARGRGTKNPFFTEEMSVKLIQHYGEGEFLKRIADELGVSVGTIDHQLRIRRLSDPEFMQALKAKRTQVMATRGRNGAGVVVDFRKHKAVACFNKPALTDLDRAIDYLRKYTGVWRERRTGLVVYGTARKTPAEIIALAERKGMAL